MKRGVGVTQTNERPPVWVVEFGDRSPVNELCLRLIRLLDHLERALGQLLTVESGLKVDDAGLQVEDSVAQDSDGAREDEHAFIFDPDRPGVFLRASDLVTDAAGNRVRLGEVVTAQATKAEFVEWLTAFFVGHDASPSGDPVASDSAPAAGSPRQETPAAGDLPTHESGDA